MTIKQFYEWAIEHECENYVMKTEIKGKEQIKHEITTLDKENEKAITYITLSK